MQRHLIDHAEFELTLPAAHGNLEEQLADFIQQRLLPLAERVFDDMAPNEQHIRIDTLELDLGDIAYADFQHEMAARFVQQLREQLHYKIDSLRNGTAQDNEGIFSVPQTNKQCLIFFLETGVLPWHKVSQQHDIDALLQQVWQQQQQELLHYLQQHSPQAPIWQRLRKQFSAALIAPLLQVMPSAYREAALASANTHTLSSPRAERAYHSPVKRPLVGVVSTRQVRNEQVRASRTVVHKMYPTMSLARVHDVPRYGRYLRKHWRQFLQQALSRGQFDRLAYAWRQLYGQDNALLREVLGTKLVNAELLSKLGLHIDTATLVQLLNLLWPQPAAFVGQILQHATLQPYRKPLWKYTLSYMHTVGEAHFQTASYVACLLQQFAEALIPRATLLQAVRQAETFSQQQSNALPTHTLYQRIVLRLQGKSTAELPQSELSQWCTTQPEVLRAIFQQLRQHEIRLNWQVLSVAELSGLLHSYLQLEQSAQARHLLQQIQQHAPQHAQHYLLVIFEQLLAGQPLDFAAALQRYTHWQQQLLEQALLQGKPEHISPYWHDWTLNQAEPLRAMLTQLLSQPTARQQLVQHFSPGWLLDVFRLYCPAELPFFCKLLAKLDTPQQTQLWYSTLQYVIEQIGCKNLACDHGYLLQHIVSVLPEVQSDLLPIQTPAALSPPDGLQIVRHGSAAELWAIWPKFNQQVGPMYRSELQQRMQQFAFREQVLLIFSKRSLIELLTLLDQFAARWLTRLLSSVSLALQNGKKIWRYTLAFFAEGAAPTFDRSRYVQGLYSQFDAHEKTQLMGQFAEFTAQLPEWQTANRDGQQDNWSSVQLQHKLHELSANTLNIATLSGAQAKQLTLALAPAAAFQQAILAYAKQAKDERYYYQQLLKQLSQQQSVDLEAAAQHDLESLLSAVFTGHAFAGIAHVWYEVLQQHDHMLQRLCKQYMGHAPYRQHVVSTFPATHLLELLTHLAPQQTKLFARLFALLPEPLLWCKAAEFTLHYCHQRAVFDRQQYHTDLVAQFDDITQQTLLHAIHALFADERAQYVYRRKVVPSRCSDLSLQITYRHVAGDITNKPAISAAVVTWQTQRHDVIHRLRHAWQHAEPQFIQQHGWLLMTRFRQALLQTILQVRLSRMQLQQFCAACSPQLLQTLLAWLFPNSRTDNAVAVLQYVNNGFARLAGASLTSPDSDTPIANDATPTFANEGQRLDRQQALLLWSLALKYADAKYVRAIWPSLMQEYSAEMRELLRRTNKIQQQRLLANCPAPMAQDLLRLCLPIQPVTQAKMKFRLVSPVGCAMRTVPKKPPAANHPLLTRQQALVLWSLALKYADAKYVRAIWPNLMQEYSAELRELLRRTNKNQQQRLLANCPAPMAQDLLRLCLPIQPVTQAKMKFRPVSPVGCAMRTVPKKPSATNHPTLTRQQALVLWSLALKYADAKYVRTIWPNLMQEYSAEMRELLRRTNKNQQQRLLANCPAPMAQDLLRLCLPIQPVTQAKMKFRPVSPVGCAMRTVPKKPSATNHPPLTRQQALVLWSLALKYADAKYVRAIWPNLMQEYSAEMRELLRRTNKNQQQRLLANCPAPMAQDLLRLCLPIQPVTQAKMKFRPVSPVGCAMRTTPKKPPATKHPALTRQQALVLWSQTLKHADPKYVCAIWLRLLQEFPAQMRELWLNANMNQQQLHRLLANFPEFMVQGLWQLLLPKQNVVLSKIKFRYADKVQHGQQVIVAVAPCSDKTKSLFRYGIRGQQRAVQTVFKQQGLWHIYHLAQGKAPTAVLSKAQVKTLLNLAFSRADSRYIAAIWPHICLSYSVELRQSLFATMRDLAQVQQLLQSCPAAMRQALLALVLPQQTAQLDIPQQAALLWQHCQQAGREVIPAGQLRYIKPYVRQVAQSVPNVALELAQAKNLLHLAFTQAEPKYIQNIWTQLLAHYVVEIVPIFMRSTINAQRMVQRFPANLLQDIVRILQPVASRFIEAFIAQLPSEVLQHVQALNLSYIHELGGKDFDRSAYAQWLLAQLPDAVRADTTAVLQQLDSHLAVLPAAEQLYQRVMGWLQLPAGVDFAAELAAEPQLLARLSEQLTEGELTLNVAQLNEAQALWFVELLTRNASAEFQQAIQAHVGKVRQAGMFYQQLLTRLLAQRDVDLEYLVRLVNNSTPKPAATTSWEWSKEMQEIQQEMFVTNSGMVLLAPYIPRLFDMLGLLQDGRLKDNAAAERAVHLLQFAVNERTDCPEPMLLLNKVLCGVMTVMPIAREIDITAQERESIEGLLQAVIQHWKILGNTSLAGLRESFMQREGRLQLINDEWHLKVDPRGIDVLLDKLPWSYGLIKHPWMLKPLFVEWRNG